MPGFYSPSIGFTTFSVSGEIPGTNTAEWFSEKFLSGKFLPIEDTIDPQSSGWVEFGAPLRAYFDAPGSYSVGGHIVFSFRVDSRKIASAALKSLCQREEQRLLTERPGVKRLSKQKRAEIKERMETKLLAKAYPVPAVVDVVWDYRKKRLAVFSTSQKTLDMFDALFKKCFEGFGLVAIHPYARAESLLDEQYAARLRGCNKANSDSVSALIAENLWLGCDFSVWALWRSATSQESYLTAAGRHYRAGDAYYAWIDDRILFAGTGTEGAQKVSVAGAQDNYAEAISALRNGKHITGASFRIEMDGQEHRFTLKCDTFSFPGWRTPKISTEKTDSPEDTRDAMFYEKTGLLEQGEELFDNLYRTFLHERLGDAWGETERAIALWTEAVS